MKVLHITNNYPTESHPIFGIFVKEQIDSLSNLGVENEVFYINGRENGRLAYWQAIKNLRRKLNRAEYDILHCHHAFSALILLLTFSFYRFKRIVSYQNPPEREGGNVLFKAILFLFHGVIIKSNSQRLEHNKLLYLPNGVNTDFFKPYNKDECIKELNLDTEKNYILFMDSYKRRAQKRVDRFNEVIQILFKNSNPHNIAPLVLTNTDRSLIPYYMSASALHLLTSDFEGSPNSVKECLSCDTQVVTTPVGNVVDLIGDIDGCYISKSFDPIELADLVKKALNFSKFEGRKKLIAKKLDFEKIAKKLRDFYKLIIDEK